MAKVQFNHAELFLFLSICRSCIALLLCRLVRLARSRAQVGMMTEKSKLGIRGYRQLPQFAITTIADANCRVGHLLHIAREVLPQLLVKGYEVTCLQPNLAGMPSLWPLTTTLSILYIFHFDKWNHHPAAYSQAPLLFPSYLEALIGYRFRKSCRTHITINALTCCIASTKYLPIWKQKGTHIPIDVAHNVTPTDQYLRMASLIVIKIRSFEVPPSKRRV